MSETVLILDASPLVYSTFAKVGHLSTKAGEPTGLRYGFIRSVRAYAEATKADKVLICYDTKSPIKKAHQSGLAGVYKSTREKTDAKQTMYDQIPALKEMLSLTRYTQVEADGYEADDLIATWARSMERQGHRVQIITTDNDLTQVVSQNVSVYMPKKDKQKPYEKDPRWVQDKFGVLPPDLLFYRAAAGDTSDDLEGTEKRLTASTKAIIYDCIKNAQGDVEKYVASIVNRLGMPEEQIRGNLIAMELVEVPKADMKITKGRKEKEALGELFKIMEAPSLEKWIDDYCGTKPPVDPFADVTQ